MPAAPPKVVIFLANRGQEPTEAATPWEVLKAAGCSITFATEKGEVASADPVLLQRSLFACILGASRQATASYKAMVASPEHQNPRSWSDKDFDILDYGAYP
jgi:putative intracellular protease/amidase